MPGVTAFANRQRAACGLALSALRAWGPRQVLGAAAAALAVGVVVGVATVLIPNPVFGREIPPEPWNYPVWAATSILTGLLVGTYIRPASDREDASRRRGARLGGVGGILAWFAVGCPVCNKIALLVLGYTGALTWFAPLQPALAALALALSAVAVVLRLRGQVACPLPDAREPVAG